MNIRNTIEKYYKDILLDLHRASNYTKIKTKYNHLIEISENVQELKEIIDFYEFKYYLRKEKYDIKQFCFYFIERNNSVHKEFTNCEITSYEIEKDILKLNKLECTDTIYTTNVSNIENYIKGLYKDFTSYDNSIKAIKVRGIITNCAKQLLYSEYLKKSDVLFLDDNLSLDEYNFITQPNSNNFEYKNYYEEFAFSSFLNHCELNCLIEKHILSYL